MSVQPSNKSGAVESFLSALSGADRRESISVLRCHPMIGCGETIEPSAFECYGPETRHEFRISGLCGTCQTSVFGGSTLD
jgi:hypothetical protein